MRRTAVVVACLALWGSVRDPAPAESTVVVWPDTRVGDEWHVGFEVNGLPGVARFEKPDEAARLYAVLAAVMINGRGE